MEIGIYKYNRLKWVMHSYNSQVFGHPKAKPRYNQERVSYAEHLTHEFTMVDLTYTMQECAVSTRSNLRKHKV